MHAYKRLFLAQTCVLNILSHTLSRDHMYVYTHFSSFMAYNNYVEVEYLGAGSRGDNNNYNVVAK